MSCSLGWPEWHSISRQRIFLGPAVRVKSDATMRHKEKAIKTITNSTSIISHGNHELAMFINPSVTLAVA